MVFALWGIDLIEKLSMTKGGAKNVIMVNHLLLSIRLMIYFVVKNTIFWYGISLEIISECNLKVPSLPTTSVLNVRFKRVFLLYLTQTRILNHQEALNGHEKLNQRAST